MATDVDQQQFLSLMDTIHDFGDTGRTKDVILQKNADAGFASFNNAVLLDFLMLSLVRDNFRDIIGLSLRHNYLTTKEDCSTNKVKDHYIAQYICRAFYWSAYEKKVVYRSPTEPEKISKNFIFASRDFPKGEKVNLTIEDAINKDGVQRNKIPFKTSINIYEDGVVKSDKVQTAFQNVLRSHKVKYVLDANALNNDIFEGKTETGWFTKYDALRSKESKEKTRSKETKTPKYEEELPLEIIEDEQQGRFDTLPYYLTRKQVDVNGGGGVGGELLVLDKIGAYKPPSKNIHSIYYDYNKKSYDINLKKNVDSKFVTGLGLFVQLINAINERTLGVLSLRQDAKDELRSKLESLGMALITDRYRLKLEMTDSSTDDSHNANGSKIKQMKDDRFLHLKKHDFIMALFDFKRAMDYLYVKACYEANKAQNDIKYVFVSSDRSAICYALNLGCPCMLTRKVHVDENGKKQQKVVIYRPDLYNKNITSKKDIKLLLQELDEEEKTYELRDDIKMQIKQLEVNKEIIEDELNMPRTSQNDEVQKLNETLEGINQEIPKLKKLKLKLKPKANASKNANIEKEVQEHKRIVEHLSPYRSAFHASPIIPKAEPDKVRNAKNANVAICDKQPDCLNQELIENVMSKTICKNWLVKLAEYEKTKHPEAKRVPPFPSALQKKIPKDEKIQNECLQKLKNYCVKTYETSLQEVPELQVFFSGRKGGEGPSQLNIPKLPPQSKQILADATTNVTTNVTPYNRIAYMNAVLDTEIPLQYTKSDTVFGDFLNAYSVLSPSISFFWHIVFKFICFHVEE